MKLAQYTSAEAYMLEDRLIAVMQAEGPLRVRNRDNDARGSGRRYGSGTSPGTRASLQRQARRRTEAGEQTRADIHQYLTDAAPRLVKAVEIAERLDKTDSCIRWGLRKLMEDGLVIRHKASSTGYAWSVAEK